MAKKDAWEQFSDLCDKFTTRTEVRRDLAVTGLAHQRGVRLSLKESDPHISGMWRTKASTQRNVGTMRELAAAIIAACDFVDKHNPEWAGRRETT